MKTRRIFFSVFSRFCCLIGATGIAAAKQQPPTYNDYAVVIAYINYNVTALNLPTFTQTANPMPWPKTMIFRNGLLQLPGLDWTAGPGCWTPNFAALDDTFTAVTLQ